MEKFSVQKPFTVLVGVIMVLVLGFVSLTSMAMDLLPTISMPMLMVITTYPGASAEKVEADVTKTLESNLGTISGVTEVTSTSSENYCMVQLMFQDGTDMDSALVKVSSAVQTASALLPETCGTPSIMEISMDMLATMYLSVSYDGYDVYQLSDFVSDTVTPMLERVDGVASISETGIVEKTIHIELDQDKIDAVNADILYQVDDGLVVAKDALDEADAEVAAAIAELDKAQSSFGKTLTDELAKMYEDPLNNTVDSLQVLVHNLAIGLDGAKLDMDDFTITKPEVTPPTQEQILAAFGILLTPEQLEAFKNGTPLTELLTLEEISTMLQDKILDTLLTDEQKQALENGATLADILKDAVDSLPDHVIDPDQMQGVLDAYNQQIAEAQYSLWGVYGKMDELPAMVDGLVGIYGGLTQMQLEAAVGFSTASMALTSAQQELASARAQYEDAKETALASANLDALLDVNTLSQLIYAQNFSMPAGYIDDKNDEAWLLKVGEEYQTPEELADALLLRMDGIGDITVSDVATVTVIDNADESFARMNGENSVVLSIYKGSTAGTNEVSGAITDAYEQLSKDYPGAHFVPLMDQGKYIDLIVASVVSSMGVGAFLAIIILAVFLKDFAPTLVVGVSIPLSVLFAIVLMYFTNISLNMMSLCGLALGIGMLVDNSIVVIENIYRLRGRGVSAARAAVQATIQVRGAIVASTLTTVCVFLPLVFTTGTVRELLMPLGLCIAYCLFASLAVALTVVPATASTLLRNSKPKDHPWFEKFQEWYGISLDFCLRRKAIPLSIAIGLLIVCVWQVFQMGIVVIPEISADNVEVSFSTPSEMTREESYALAEEVMMAMVEVDNVSSVGVMGAGGSASLLGFGGSDDSYGSYTYYVTVSENAGAAEINKACADIEAVVADIGYEVAASSSGMGDLSAMTASGLTITIKGDDMDTLEEISHTVSDLIKDVEGYDEVYSSLGEGEPTIQLEIDKDKAMECGLTVAQIYMEIASYLTDEATSTTLTVDGESMKVIVQDFTSPLTVENLMDMKFEATSMTASAAGGMGGMDMSAMGGSMGGMDLSAFGMGGDTANADADTDTESDADTTEEAEEEPEDNIYKLSDFASIVETTSVASISRENQARYITVSASTLEGYNATLLSRKVEDIIGKANADGTFPSGYTVTVGGESDEVTEMVEQMLLMILLALIFIYLVMVAQFQSLLSPFIVLFTIPLAFTGGLLALLLVGQQLSMLSIMGFLVLMGTVVNNGIVFVDYTNQLRIGGMERAAALIATGQTRMRPILMTALTTILAMVQLMMGDDMASQMAGGMALVVTGGLIYATLMTLYIIPVMYDILFKRPPLAVDVGEESLDDVPDDAAEFIAAALAKQKFIAAANGEETVDEMHLEYPDRGNGSGSGEL